MAHAPVLDRKIMELLPEDIDERGVLDVASGLGSWGYQIRTRARGAPRITGLDIWVPYIRRVCSLSIYDDMVCADARRLPFRDSSFHAILACEVLEHLRREEGADFLTELERVARRILIVTTPLGFTYQGDVNGNVHERHVSAWKKEDLEGMGYDVRVLNVLPLPRTLRMIDGMRRRIFRLPPSPKEIVAIKLFALKGSPRREPEALSRRDEVLHPNIVPPAPVVAERRSGD
jgi:hypothetical protein